MRVDCLWVSWHDDILARGYADQGGLEDCLSRKMWIPPDPLTFVHHEVRGDFPDVPGALVVLPARHHASPEDVSRLKAEIDKLPWCLLFLSGDEEGIFPFEEFPESDRLSVYVMQPMPKHRGLTGNWLGGYYPWVRDGIIKADKTTNIFFAGQVQHDNIRRLECVKYLRRMRHVLLHETAGYLQGWPREEYLAELSKAKLVPSPSGPMTVDTARPLEAMEAACVPLLDTVNARGQDQADYWTDIFGDHPIPTVKDWREMRWKSTELLADFTWWSNRVSSFWQAYKRKIALKLDRDIKEVMNHTGDLLPDRPVTSEGLVPDDLVTVVITTSPAPIHPSLDHIAQVVNSVRERLPRAEILIACDGVRQEDGALKDAYFTYLSELLWASNWAWDNVLPVVMDEFLHQALTTKRVLDMVTTPYVLFLEHDTPLEGDIPFDKLCNALDGEQAKCIRFHFDVELHPEHEPLHIDERPFDVEGVPLRRIRVFWARPFLCHADWFRAKLDLHFDENSRTFIEDKLYGILHSDWEDDGIAGWERWRIWTYFPDGNIKRSGHLDSRGSHKKHAMTF